MPVVRKLEIEEVQTIERKNVGQRKLREQEYDEYLRQFATGDWGELTLDSGETRLSVRHQMNKAAIRAGADLEWKRSTGDTLRFHVISSPFESVADEDDEGNDEGLESFELPEPEPEPAPPVVAAPVKPKRKAAAVTDRQPYVEAP